MSLPEHVRSLVSTTPDFQYVRLKTFTVAARGLMSPDNVSKEAGDFLNEVFRNGSSEPLLVNCRGIATLSNYAFYDLHELLDHGPPEHKERKLVFFNACDHLAEDISTHLPHAIKLNGGIVTLNFGPNPDQAAHLQLIQNASAVEAVEIREIIKNSFHPNSKERMQFEPLHSTPVLASGVYNARRIVCDPPQFNRVVLMLEEKLDELLPDWDPMKHSLLSGSLRACPFAAALAFMKTPSRAVAIHDHFGPQSTLLEEHDFEQQSRRMEYIYIGDFMIGGTEIKIARNWAAKRHCSLTKALLLGSLWDGSRYFSRNEVEMRSIVSLKDLNPEAQFKFE